MSEAVGQFVFLDGYCGRIEARQGSTVFLRIDESSEPERVTEARMHFQGRHEGDEVFPGEKLWANGEPVRVAAFKWDSRLRALRLKVERA